MYNVHNMYTNMSTERQNKSEEDIQREKPDPYEYTLKYM